MARIAGVNIPQNKVVHVALTYIHGIGKKYSNDICSKLNISKNKRVNSLTVSLNIKRLVDLATYRGSRHKKKLPVRGQRTHCNARTRKGKAIAIAGKKLTPMKK